jgi:hypothetical protein
MEVPNSRRLRWTQLVNWLDNSEGSLKIAKDRELNNFYKSASLQGVAANLGDIHRSGHDPHYGQVLGVNCHLLRLLTHPLISNPPSGMSQGGFGGSDLKARSEGSV